VFENNRPAADRPRAGDGARRGHAGAGHLGDALRTAAGIQSGVFMVAGIGSGGWIEFERGDPDHPIGSAVLGARAEVPVLALVPPAIRRARTSCSRPL